LYLETCPHYLLLDESAYGRENGHRYITTPPLRTPADREALWQALTDGEIDTIGTDHCPFTCAQKDPSAVAFQEVPNGLSAVETRFALLYTYGALDGRLSPSQLSRLLATNAARIFRLPGKGEVRPGADADLFIWDPEPETMITHANQHGRADWTPYDGVPVAGRLTHTLLRGRCLVENGEWVAGDPAGQLLPRMGIKG
jgi:dihydropyrimidinase